MATEKFFSTDGLNFSNGNGTITGLANINNQIVIDGGNLSVTGNIEALNLGNASAISLDGSSSNVLYGNGVFAPATGTYSNSNVVSLLSSFGSNSITTTGNIDGGNILGNGQGLYSITGSNVTGEVAYANVANSVAAANVIGLGNIALANFDGSSSNVLYGNGVFAPGGGGGANVADYLDGNIAVDLIPTTNVAYNLGNATRRFNSLYLANNTIYLGDSILSTGSNGQLTTSQLVATEGVSNVAIIGWTSNSLYVRTTDPSPLDSAFASVKQGDGFRFLTGDANIVPNTFVIATGFSTFSNAQVGFNDYTIPVNNAYPGGNIAFVYSMAFTNVPATSFDQLTGNINTPGNITSSGGITATLGVSAAGDVLTDNDVSAGGNVVAGNITASTALSSTGNVVAGGNLSAVGNATAANVVVSGVVTATGNVIGGNVVANGIVTANGASFSANVNMSNASITTLAEPQNPQDAATKNYVDSFVQGLTIHPSAAAATNDDLTVITGGTTNYNNGSSGVGATITTTGSFTTIDTVNIATVGTRILVKNESNSAWNGVYTYTNSTTITRATDFDATSEMVGGDFIFVSSGNVYADTSWVQTTDAPVVGTSPIVFTQFGAAGTYLPGTGLSLDGTQFNVSNSLTQVTSVGTLTSLDVSGNAGFSNVSVNGSITATDVLSNNITVTGNIVPTVANVSTLGTENEPFLSLYVSENTIYLGNTSVSAANGSVTTTNFQTVGQGGVSYVNWRTNSRMIIRTTTTSQWAYNFNNLPLRSGDVFTLSNPSPVGSFPANTKVVVSGFATRSQVGSFYDFNIPVTTSPAANCFAGRFAFSPTTVNSFEQLTGNVQAANVVGLGNVAFANFDGNASNVLYGNGGFARAYSNSNVQAYLNNLGALSLSTAGNITANNFIGNIAVGNVVGLGNVALISTDGNSQNVLWGNGQFASATAISYGNSNVITLLSDYTNNILTTGNVTANNFNGKIAAGNVTGLGTLATTNSDGNASNVLYGNGLFAQSYGNSNVVALLSAFGSNNISTGGNISANNFIGNISATYVQGLGNVAYLNRDGSSSNVLYGNGTFGPILTSYNDGNVTALLQSFGANTITTSGNVRTGNLSVVGNINGSNINVGSTLTDYLTVYVRANIANLSVSGTITSAGNITAPWFIGNVAVANVIGLGNISTINRDGNASNVLYGNGVFGPVVSPYGNSNVATFLNSFGSNNITSTGNIRANVITANLFVGNIAASNVTGLGNLAFLNRDGNASNILYGNGVFGPVISPYGNPNVATFLASFGSNSMSTTGNVTATNFFGNIAAGNVIGLGNVAFLNRDGNASNILYGNGVFAAAPTGGGYGNSNVATFLASFGANTITTTGNISVGNVIGNVNGVSIGYRDVPQIILSSTTTIEELARGKHYYSTNSGNLTLNIPTNSVIPMPIGSAISIVVNSSGNVLVNALAGVTLYLAGISSPGNRVVGSYGIATLLKVGTDIWYLNGTGAY